MKLCAIYNVWADYDWLIQSVKHIHPLVDGIIIISSEYSNYGEYCEQFNYWEYEVFQNTNVRTFGFEPKEGISPMINETTKRNFGLDTARKEGYTHFLMMDADEFYNREELLSARQYLDKNPELNGLVCNTRVYVKSTTLTIGLDTTLVPCIQKITPNLRHEFNRKFPYAWIDGNIKIDPTRSTNAVSGIKWMDITMEHYSWVRKDYERKIRNSTARPNIEKMNLAKKIVHLKEGDVFDLYPGKPLIRVSNKFGLPEFNGEVLE